MKVEPWSGKSRADPDAMVELWRNLDGLAKCILHRRNRYVTRQRENIRTNNAWFSSENLIARFKSSECTDVRDRVYGLLGLINEEEVQNFPITVNYSEPADRLFFRLYERRQQQLSQTYQYVRDTRGFMERFADNLREALDLPADFGSLDGIPSWVSYLEDLEEEMSELYCKPNIHSHW